MMKPAELESTGEVPVKKVKGDIFRKIVAVNKSNKKGASVTLYDSYPDNWKLFVNRDMDATVAVTDEGDIISLSKSDKSKESLWGLKGIQIGVKNGGTHCDCFNTVLPFIYAKAGMTPVAKIKWNDEYAPKDWDYNEYKEFNGGRPDVIFMVYDGISKPLSLKNVPEFSSYDEAKAFQKKVVKMMKEKNEKSGEKKASENNETVLGNPVEQLKKELLEEMMKLGFSKERAEYWLNREF